jgi:CelD/BcsL family acetyltransferase involved in cellulose biosynthesis
LDLHRGTLEFPEIEEGWRAYAERLGNAFITPEWTSAWLQHYRDEATSVVAVVRRPGGEVRGVMPLVQSRLRRPATIRFAGNNIGDYFHPAAQEDEQAQVAAAAARAVWAEDSRSVLVLDNVDARSGWWREMAAGSGRPLAVSVYRETALPRVDFRGEDWETFLAARSRNLRSQLRRRERKLEREHALRYRRTQTEAELGLDLTTLFELHDARWRGRGGSSSASPRVRAFHHDFALAALRRGWLRLWFLEADGEEVAAWYGWHLGGRYSYYLAGFDPNWAHRNVGTVLLAHTMRSAIEEGADSYELLLGQEAYKARFATTERPVCTVILTPRLHPARLLVGTEVIGWKLARRIPHRLRRGARAMAAVLPGTRRR